MTATPWVQNISYIQDSLDYVRARDTNRPTRELAQRTQHLYEALSAAQVGEMLMARNVPLDPLTVPGTPVWYDTTDNVWKPGQAILDVAEGNDFGFAAPESEIRGLVLVKHTQTTGDIALYGRINNSVWGIDWPTVIDDQDLVGGRYYLATDSGKITRSRNVLSVEIGVLNSSGDLVFTPDITGSLRAHLHLRFELEAVIGADLTEAGWVPIAEFDAEALPHPVGAVYGYNLSQNTGLLAKFPPQPVDNFFLAYLGVGVHKDSLVVDDDGIWWMNATNTPDNMGTHLYQTDEAAEYFEFWMTQLNTGGKLVSSLQTLDASSTLPITIENLVGDPQDNGDLRIYLEQALRVPELVDESDEGGYALKTVSGVKGVRGPVVNRLLAGPGISISGSLGTAADGQHGTVQISTESALLTLMRGQPTLAALDNAREDFYNQQLPVINLPADRRSGVKLKIQIPPFLVGNFGLVLNIGMVSAGGASSSLGLQYMIVRPGAAVPASPTVGTSVTVVLPINQLTTISTSQILGLQGGDLLLIDLLRTTPPGVDLMIAGLDYVIAAV